MRIAIVSTPFARVPFEGCGTIELFCRQLAEALLGRGHEVTLFATGDSRFSGELRSCFPSPSWPPLESVERAHVRYCLHEISRDRQGYDVVQINSALGLKTARDLGLPVVCTIHDPRTDQLSSLYESHPEVHYVAVSRSHLEHGTPLRQASVIHYGMSAEPGVPRERDQGEQGDRGYVLFRGRFAPENGPHLAIDAATLAGTPIVLDRGPFEFEKEKDGRYFDAELAPRLDGSRARSVQSTDPASRRQLLQGARALLCPFQNDEPFELVAIEAMFTGTPVVAFARGSLPEIVDQEITGLLVSDAQEMAQAIIRAAHWDRRRSAEHARARFSADRMAAEYERVFESMLARRSAAVISVSEPFPARQFPFVG